MSRDKALRNFLSLPSIIIMFLVGFLPVWWTAFYEYEGTILPVVEDVKVEPVRYGNNSIEVLVSFNKVRQCEFIGISWYDQSGKRLVVVFDSRERDLPRTRPKGYQNSGVWKIIGTNKLDGTHAVVSHKCHPLWTTFTKFYP